ncbi:unnamed protein product [Menidia menidia]|uniref:(Atlantic silverside) hypothetical protein n=1 Tax=Menidia menidia TaxID=238744 RepID=A0A8S4AG45_9TELE|nr:unnamed protein product [Menidia menidia]
MNFTMTGTSSGKKLDLSRLTDDEAKHVWEVVQRDFDLRKKEEERLGELKTKIAKEDIKRELLGNQSSLAESHCIRCLQAFVFLVNIKRQCLDCSLYICKSCSRYNKKEQGWVCDPCHMARVLKIGTLEWYHENVRARFKRFGSAKVMRSLFKRLSGDHNLSHSDLGDTREYDTQSMPDVHIDGYEHSMDAADSQYKGMKKTKRRLIVDPCDFIPGCDYSQFHKNQATNIYGLDVDMGVRDSLLAEGDMDHGFHITDQEQPKCLDLEMAPLHDDLAYVENRTVSSRSISRLSYSSCGSGSAGDIEIMDLNMRMSVIETLLNRLEQKVTPTNDEIPTASSASPSQWEEVDLEEQQLRQKLHKMTDNISDHSLTSDEDEPNGAYPSEEVSGWRSSSQGDSKPSRIPTRASTFNSRIEGEMLLQIYPQKFDSPLELLGSKEHLKQEPSISSFTGSTALLVELEDKVAEAAANVQNAQSEVFYIENRIAALNAAGTPMEKRRRSAVPSQARRLSHNFPTKTNNDAGLMRRRLSVM